MISVTTIKRAQIDARFDVMKTKNPRSEIVSMLLSTLIGELEKQQKTYKKELTELEIIQVVKQYIKNINETEKVAGVSDKTQVEKETLIKFLPAQKTNSELETIINSICEQTSATTIKEFGKVFGQLRKDHDGTYDNEYAAVYIKKKLQGE